MGALSNNAIALATVAGVGGLVVFLRAEFWEFQVGALATFAVSGLVLGRWLGVI
jgi:hypothetical protein